ncbi:HlyD family efflux transporter periplasmic adaptor subunit [Pseudooceanicola sediminis]|uniref:HlyD family efflux transporter periplasmic adaptor subunit n=1 Tax=Pseudooceanicola sediminis TaxID=2211117 RepID=A0A399J9Y1_9RHOB|nr:HlyD family efflux transporter periplasmic adaptor subunit [Pseudooceanicola sediminis]KAA2314588.1 HlyD family efflux transporter periplasmic adaptor subunit [Puniceibacterium sp. HSS470]RII39456.1 HlyD family efflux transporter periplasmic adaptor subunit [Pseudooceanicola sediminis]|tara:strand:- start:3714 stop:5189 length:1476 start_codon:yes stop_codon:yes gene_type:complete
MRFLTRSLSGLFLLAVTLGLLVYAGTLVASAIETRMSQEPFIPKARERAFTVNVVHAQPETIAPVLTAYGSVQSRRTLDIRASATGPVVHLAAEFREGGRVEQGQTLLRVDPQPAQAALDRAVADLADAQAEVRDAERGLVIARDTLHAAEDQARLRGKALTRQNQLVERGIGSAAAVEEAELSAASARQSVLASRSALAQAEARIDSAATALDRARIARDVAQRGLDDTVITAVFDGTLSGVTLVQGRLLSANEMLAQLIDPDAMEVAFRISTAQYARMLDEKGRLKPLPVSVSLDNADTALTASGHISRDNAAVGEGQTGRVVLATLDQTRGLKPGDFVTVKVLEDPLNGVIRLPATALDASGQVLVLAEGNRLDVMQVVLVRRQGDDVLVRSDDLAGRDVVAQRTPLLGRGILVRANRARQDGTARTEDGPAQDSLVELSAEQRARLVAFVEASQSMPAEAKSRILAQLDQPKVPAATIARLESRMGG